MNVDQRQAAADPHSKPTNLGCEFTSRVLSSTPTITILYYSAQKLIPVLIFTIPWRVEVWINLGTPHCSEGVQPMLKAVCQ